MENEVILNNSVNNRQCSTLKISKVYYTQVKNEVICLSSHLYMCIYFLNGTTHRKAKIIHQQITITSIMNYIVHDSKNQKMIVKLTYLEQSLKWNVTLLLQIKDLQNQGEMSHIPSQTPLQSKLIYYHIINKYCS